MKKPLLLTLATLILLTTAACGGGGRNGGGNPPPAPTPTTIEPGLLGDGRLGEIVGWIREQYDVPAVTAMIVADGVVVEQAADGVRSIDDPTAVTVADQWHLGSVSKAMTATLTAVLVEQSLLRWDTTPADVWPEDLETMNPAYRDVTIVQLLAHQAGIQPDQGLIPSIDATVDTAPGTIVEKRRLWARELLQLDPANPAGEFNYANGGYIIAGAMLETLTGQSWEALMEQNVFGPLGMLSSGFGAPGTPGQVDQPHGHWFESGRLVAVEPGPGADNSQAIGPAGTVHTTMDDYALFMFAHLEGELGMDGLVSADTYRFLHQPVGGHDYALGWFTDDDQEWANGELLYHLGTNGRWIANAGIVPGLNVGLFIGINMGGQTAVDASDELAGILLNRILDSR